MGTQRPFREKPRFYEEVLEMQTVLQLVQIVTLVALVVYVIKTWHMASATKQMAEASRRTLEEMKESRDILTRPYVIVYFDSPPGQAWFELVIENTGSGSARDINLKFDPPLRNSRENLMGLEVFKKGISLLPPHQKIKLFFDIGFSYFGKNLPMRYQVKVTYGGGLGDVLRTENYMLDLSIYKNLPSIKRKSMHELVEVMEKVLKEIPRQQKSHG